MTEPTSDSAAHHDPTGQPMADPAPATSPEEGVMLDAFRSQPYDPALTVPDASKLDVLKLLQDDIAKSGLGQ